jgi:hypothetical protein
MTTDLNDFAQYLTWSSSTVRHPLLWKRDYVQFLKDRADPLVEQNKELADAVHQAADGQWNETLFCPRVLWALTQVVDQAGAIQEMLNELTVRRAIIDQQRLPLHSSVNSCDPKVDLEIAGIMIDFESEFELPGEFQSLVAAPPRRQEIEYQRINSALTELEVAFPAIFQFVTDLTYRIAVRFRPDNPKFSMFGSFTEYPGIMLMVNPWQAKVDIAQIIEAIVHENIHHAIAMFEAVRHDLTPGFPASSVHRSPWTGNLLTCHQFVEACFVWWGLYRMWLTWPPESCLLETRTRELRNRALKGFGARPASMLVDTLGASALPEDTTAALFGIERAAMESQGGRAA